MNNFLLAGANGLIGSFLYNRFHKDYSITALDYSKGSIEENFSSVDLTQEIEVATFVLPNTAQPAGCTAFFN